MKASTQVTASTSYGKETPYLLTCYQNLWMLQKMEYIQENPVKAGLCIAAEEYPYSSAKFYETGVDEFNFLKHWMD